MLNPDGVVIGNTRTCFEGYDLNRCWSAPDKSVHIPIYYLKRILKQIYKRNRELFLFCDLHGHGKLPNSFIYACNRATDGDFSSWTKIRLLPKILSKYCPYFSYNNCQFKVEAEKKDTGRVVIWKEFGVMNSFTFETSIFGYTDGDTFIRFKESDIISIGETFVKALYEYSTIIRDLGKEMMISKAYNFLYDQVDKSTKDERFPVIEIKEKKGNNTKLEKAEKTDKLSQKIELKDDLKYARSTESSSPRPSDTPSQKERKANMNMDEDLLDAVIDMTDLYDQKQRQAVSKLENSPLIMKKSTVKTKVMNFGGALASLKPYGDNNRCITRLATSKDSRDCSSSEYFLPAKFPEPKPIQNAILKIREESLKRQTSVPEEISSYKSMLKTDLQGRNKCEEYIVYKIAPHISIRINRLDMNLGIKPAIISEITEKNKILHKVREAHQQVIQTQYGVYPSFLNEDIKVLEPPKTRGSSTITQRSAVLKCFRNQAIESKDPDITRRRGHSLRKLLQ
jgi:hypothetical protein